MNKGKSLLSPVILISVGLLVLAGYLIDIPLLGFIRTIFSRWAVILSAVALLVGVGNLFSVHWRKASTGEPGSFYSMILVITLAVTLLVVGYFSPASPWSIWIYNYIQVPVEASLMAILAVVLIVSITRLLRRRMDTFTVVFVGTALFMLIAMAPIFGIEIQGLSGPGSLRELIAQVPVIGGARGLLIGISLGIITTALRILIGVDRPYGG